MKTMSKTQQVLARLRQDRVVSNVELNKICFRYSDQIFRLRREGYIIGKEHVKDYQWNYIFNGHVDDNEKEYGDVA